MEYVGLDLSRLTIRSSRRWKKRGSNQIFSSLCLYAAPNPPPQKCFIRSEILEVFRASPEDVRVRNNSKTLSVEQVGIRCRFCAHIPPSSRASRSSAFPSSIPQIYQSFTMVRLDYMFVCLALIVLCVCVLECLVQLQSSSS